MNLPPHGRTTCLGIDLHGHHEPCDERIPEGSPYPFCEAHYRKLLELPRKRTCAGAMTYDAAMRAVRIACENVTGHPEEALCASCRVVESKEKRKAKEALAERCPHCGQAMPPSKARSMSPSVSTAAGRKTHSTAARGSREPVTSFVHASARRSDRSPPGPFEPSSDVEWWEDD